MPVTAFKTLTNPVVLWLPVAVHDGELDNEWVLTSDQRGGEI